MQTTSFLYRVLQPSLTEDEERRFAEQFQLQLKADGLPYVSPNFLSVPPQAGVATSDSSQDATEPISTGNAVRLVEAALDRAGLRPDSWAGVDFELDTDHTTLELAYLGGEQTQPEQLLLDTHVNSQLTVDGARLVGPGAKLKVIFGLDGRALYVAYALPRLKQDREIVIRRKAEVRRHFRRLYRLSGLDPKIKIKLVYFAPPLSGQRQKYLYPYYLCEAATTIQEEQAELTRVLIPAIANSPRAEIQLHRDENGLLASVATAGGVGPYSYTWHDGSRPFATSGSQAVHRPLRDASRRTLTVAVEDARGIVTTASSPLPAPPFGVDKYQSEALLTAGAEWVGGHQDCHGELRFMGANANDFTSTLKKAGWSILHNLGQKNVRERHFLEPPVGLDPSYVDAVDFAFFGGHGHPGGFTLCTNDQDRWVDFEDKPRWGNHRLAWLVLMACNVLKSTPWARSTWWEAWGPAFAGLHLLLGFENLVYDHPGLGAGLAKKAVSGKTILKSWVEACMDIQPSDTRWAAMGWIGKDGLAHWDDKVSALLKTPIGKKGTKEIGYWLLHGTS